MEKEEPAPAMDKQSNSHDSTVDKVSDLTVSELISMPALSQQTTSMPSFPSSLPPTAPSPTNVYGPKSFNFAEHHNINYPDKHRHRRSLDPDAEQHLYQKHHRRRSSNAAAAAVYGSSSSSGMHLETRQSQNYYHVDKDKWILVTGGAGYIGSHTVLELLTQGLKVVVIDNFYNSSEESLIRVQKLVDGTLEWHNVDVLDAEALSTIFKKYDIWAVIHFAAMKAVGESAQIPLSYYRNNISGTINLLQCMQTHGVKNFVFSSSATVYGESEATPVKETAKLGPVTNPYGRTKLFGEDILRDLYNSDHSWNIVILRYFNPVGAHSSGLIGEHPNGIPNNLLPYVSQVVQGRLPYLRIFGNDYPTIDGTGVRDFIHVCDLATGHVKAIEKLAQRPGCVAYNLGTGVGYSVLQIVHAMERATGVSIDYKIEPRRPGDIAVSTADATLANRELGWWPMKQLDEMCEDMWRWARRNPGGYDGMVMLSDSGEQEIGDDLDMDD
ncbi:hypothetical protein BZG36_03737, partial [Bifiguratus adelaidae]